METPSLDVKKPIFQVLKSLSNGSYGNVFLALDANAGRRVAVKVMPQKFYNVALHEFEITKALDHPNIVRTFNCFTDQGRGLALIQEYASQGDLYEMINSGSINDYHVRRYFSQIVDGLEYLHAKGIVHRDMKPENVVVDEKDVAKICDFGAAAYHGAAIVTGGKGSTPYRPPETVNLSSREMIAHTSQDVWAMGILLYVLLLRELPWLSASSTDKAYTSFVAGDYGVGAWQKFAQPLVEIFKEIFAPQSERCEVWDLRRVLDVEWFPVEKLWFSSPMHTFGRSSISGRDSRISTGRESRHSTDRHSRELIPI